MNNTPDHSFKQAQQKFERVSTAYAEKEKQMLAILKSNSITTNTLQVCFIAYKQEKTLELWGKNKTDNAYILLKTYDFCASSGILGPKRGNGDLQTPEGFYHIDRFNPVSNKYMCNGALSLCDY